eukprot:scaffold2113_cov106-Skeletonema_dohrnii-CCMP3373.AAC.1
MTHPDHRSSHDGQIHQDRFVESTQRAGHTKSTKRSIREVRPPTYNLLRVCDDAQKNHPGGARRVPFKPRKKPMRVRCVVEKRNQYNYHRLYLTSPTDGFGIFRDANPAYFQTHAIGYLEKENREQETSLTSCIDHFEPAPCAANFLKRIEAKPKHIIAVLRRHCRLCIEVATMSEEASKVSKELAVAVES